jgi:hypothetical protein
MQTPAYWPETLLDRRNEFAVVQFRKRFQLPATQPMRLWISASQRFELYLDGRRIARGPSRSDRFRWFARPVDLGAVDPGAHVLAVRVIHFAGHGGVGQMGPPAFLLVADELDDPEILAARPWRCRRDRSTTPTGEHHWPNGQPYYVVGCGERTDAARVLDGWAELDFDDANWPEPAKVCNQAHDPWGNVRLGCLLRPDPLGSMRGEPMRFARLVEAPDDLAAQAETWLTGQGPLRIAAGRSVRLVLDAEHLRNGWPRLVVSGGRGGQITWISAEAPYTGTGRDKARRDDADGREFYGHRDVLLPDGRRLGFETMWYRSFRYVELRIEAGPEAVQLEDISYETTGYPLARRTTADPGPADGLQLRRILEVSWRSIRLCARETFYDCPHYEQAQFPGDTRIQAIFHYLLADDDGLARKAIDDFYGSRMPGGLTQCRWPSSRDQILPTFSLQWVGMLEDFRVYRGDLDFLRAYMHAAREVVDWFAAQLRDDGLLGQIPHAPFVDWSPGFAQGNAPQGPRGGSSILTAMYASACGNLARLERACGYPSLEALWRRRARAANAALVETCWDADRRLLADTPARESFSVHGQCEAILSGALDARQAAAALETALGADRVAQPGTFYYRHYLLAAMREADLGGRICETFSRWSDKLDATGLTTWPESDRQDSRSDCHAWSVAPAIQTVQTLLGIAPDPEANGFARAIFQPTPAEGLKELSGSVSTPAGTFHVAWQGQPAASLAAELICPVPTCVAATGKVLDAGRHEVRIG